CLEAPAGDEAARRWQGELEVEQAVEDYLARERAGEPHRPVALVGTKADLLPEWGDADAGRKLAGERFGMTRHTLETHCPWHEVFAISSLPPAAAGLEGPLTWLARTLKEQDRSRLDRLWEMAPSNLALLATATAAYTRRYPECAHG